MLRKSCSSCQKRSELIDPLLISFFALTLLPLPLGEGWGEGIDEGENRGLGHVAHYLSTFQLWFTTFFITCAPVLIEMKLVSQIGLIHTDILSSRSFELLFILRAIDHGSPSPRPCDWQSETRASSIACR